ncbi:hypothetical protein DFH09DRAFT_1089617 [Mycena vulgaris]|nr:hypothetical protein DFH09DRAFT_1089617 [Mycena vulgaris]
MVVDSSIPEHRKPWIQLDFVASKLLREWICRKSRASVLRYREAYEISEAKTQWEKGQSVVLRLSIIWRGGVRLVSASIGDKANITHTAPGFRSTEFGLIQLPRRARASFRAGPFFPVLVGTIWVPSDEDESISRPDQYDEAMLWRALLLDVRLFPWIGHSFDQKDQMITVAEATIIIARIISRFSTSNIHDTLQSVAEKIPTGVVFDSTVAAAIIHLLADPELISRSPPRIYLVVVYNSGRMGAKSRFHLAPAILYAELFPPPAQPFTRNLQVKRTQTSCAPWGSCSEGVTFPSHRNHTPISNSGL